MVESKFDLAPVQLNIQDRTADVRTEYTPQLPLQLLGDKGSERRALGMFQFDVVLAFRAPQPICRPSRPLDGLDTLRSGLADA